MKNYIVSHRADHELKEISVTARDPNRSGCQIINIHGRCKLRWNQSNTNPNFEKDDWEIDFVGLTRKEAREIKVELLNTYLKLGYTIRKVTNTQSSIKESLL